MGKRIRTAVIPAAGFGTRMLPATRAVPKELLPVGRKPAIEWAISEAIDAGIDWFVIVSSPRKPAIDAYVLGLNDPETIPNVSKPPLATEFAGGHIELIHQPVARGLGDAVRLAHSVLGAEPFALLLPDEILLGGSRLLKSMLDDFEHTGQSGVSLLEVDRSEIGSYGCAAIDENLSSGERLRITRCIEKPNPTIAPSCYALSGRYVLGADVLDLLDGVEADRGGEVQFTPALDEAAMKWGLAGFIVRDEDGRVDVGNWDGWLEANARLFSTDDSDDILTSAANGDI